MTTMRVKRVTCGKEEVVVYYRPGTNDEAVIKEVLEGRCYRRPSVRFDVRRGERWLDLGAHIGSFGLYALARGASVVCYEPEPDTYRMLSLNMEGRAGVECHRGAVTASCGDTVRLYDAGKGDDRRKTTRPNPRARGPVVVANVYVGGLRAEAWDGVKMDIEGAEFDILDQDLLPPCRKLVLEYHSSRDSSASNLKDRIERLRRHFVQVCVPPEYERRIGEGRDVKTYFDRLIFCQNRSLG